VSSAILWALAFGVAVVVETGCAEAAVVADDALLLLDLLS
jgi:hypothetical protein